MTLRPLLAACCALLLVPAIGCVPGASAGADSGAGEGEGEGEGEPAGSVAPGGACGCDAECEGSATHAGVCVYGVCFQEASGDCSGDGSQAECPDGSRCWPLVPGGAGLCWPDCDTHDCEGTCDGDGSCAPSTGATCDDTCSTQCVDSGGGGGDGGGGGGTGETFDLGAPPPAPVTSCADIPSFECTVAGGTTAQIEAFCGELIPFSPRQGDGYDDYPINGETSTDQYRSFARRDVVMLVQYATAHTRCTAAGWDFGDSVLGLGDMSEEDGAIPGTSDGEPGHPEGSHLRGYDMDIGYYQLGAANNRLREVCPHTEGGQDALHCTGDPTSLDVWRTTVFIAKLMDSPQYLTVGVDGRIGPILQQAAAVLCDEGIIDGKACGSQGFAARRNSFGAGLSFDIDEASQIGWYFFHHHHLHLSVIDKEGNILPNW